MIPKLVFVACLASTLFMTGVIWFVQVVHYPLMDRVGPESFEKYHAGHTNLTDRVVLVPMVVELLSSVWLIWDRPRGFRVNLASLGLILAVLTWGITFFLSIPAHNRLSLGFNAATHRSLVTTNWFRLVAWTAHSVVLLVAISRSIV